MRYWEVCQKADTDESYRKLKFEQDVVWVCLIERLEHYFETKDRAAKVEADQLYRQLQVAGLKRGKRFREIERGAEIEAISVA